MRDLEDPGFSLFCADPDALEASGSAVWSSSGGLGGSLVLDAAEISRDLGHLGRALGAPHPPVPGDFLCHQGGPRGAINHHMVVKSTHGMVAGNSRPGLNALKKYL